MHSQPMPHIGQASAVLVANHPASKTTTPRHRAKLKRLTFYFFFSFFFSLLNLTDRMNAFGVFQAGQAENSEFDGPGRRWTRR